MVNWLAPRELYESLLDYRGNAVYREVIEPWVEVEGDLAGQVLAALAEMRRPRERGDQDGAAISYFGYALSRVSDVFTLAWNPLPAGRAAVDHAWFAIEPAQDAALFTALGMRVLRPEVFEGVLCEIVEVVEVADDPDAPITLAEVVWPALMVGELVFRRAGVRVRAGRRHAAAGVADGSPLHWTYRRRHRRTFDLSMGWGSNSQYRTHLRRDFVTDDVVVYNADGTDSPDGTFTGPLDDEDVRALTARQRREVLVHRGFLRAPEPEQPAASLTAELWVYDLTLTENRR